MVHTYSLIHDDLPCMDDDDFRRGQPTNPRYIWEANAVLAGDGLFHRCLATLAKAPLPPERICQGIATLAQAAGPTEWWAARCWISWGKAVLTEEEITTIEALKTGCMIEAAARLGAIANSTRRRRQPPLPMPGSWPGLPDSR